MIYNESPRRQQITKQVSWGHWFAFANILLACIISSVYLFSTPIADTPISFVYLITTWLGHTSFITFLGFVILIMPLCYKVSNLRVLKGVSSVIAAVCLALLAFDALLYNNTGFHVSFSSADLLRNEAQGQINAFGWLQWFYLILLFIIWLSFQLVIANAIFKRVHRFQKLKIGPYITVGLVLCFVTSHAIHVWADARLYTPVLKQDNMFPLSYPATAKTLMARYGLLDLEERLQQEELLYNSEDSRFNYPPKQVYCSVDNTKKLIVLASMESLNVANIEQMKSNQFHLNMMANGTDFYQQLIYGIPENLLSMTSAPPVAIELLQAFDVPFASYNFEKEDNDFEAFSQVAAQSDAGFYLAILNQEQLSTIDISDLAQNNKLILIHKSATGQYVLSSNFITNNNASSNEDLIPTVLTEFGCLAEPDRYSTGQSLQTAQRNWLVTTSNSNIVMLKYPYLTEVAKDGSYEVTDLRSSKKVLVDLDTNLLSRSIKHLKDFSDK